MKYFQYLNLFFVMTIFGFLVFFCRYFLQKDEKYIQDLFGLHNGEKQLVNHVLFLPNFFHFVQNETLINKDALHFTYIKNIFEYAETCFKNNIHQVSIELLTVNEIQAITQEVFDHFFTDSLWTMIDNYAKKLDCQIDILCDDHILSPKQKKIIETYKKKINIHTDKKIFKINFLIHYDTITELQFFFNHFVNSYHDIDRENIHHICHRNNLDQILNKYFAPYDIIFACRQAFVTDSALLHTNGSRIININYSLDELNPNIIDVIIKTSINNQYEN